MEGPTHWLRAKFLREFQHSQKVSLLLAPSYLLEVAERFQANHGGCPFNLFSANTYWFCSVRHVLFDTLLPKLSQRKSTPSLAIHSGIRESSEIREIGSSDNCLFEPVITCEFELDGKMRRSSKLKSQQLITELLSKSYFGFRQRAASATQD
ncbi:MAG: hypothetical protein RLY14_985 [Planctomycetota bacterium]|jgi:hypothetical protein